MIRQERLRLPPLLAIGVTQSLPDEASRMLDAALDQPWARLLRAASASVSNLTVGGSDPAMRAAHVLFGQPHPEDVLAAEDLRWVHLSSAGWTRYATPAFTDALAVRGIALTTSSTVYAEPCAEHALAFLLAAERSLMAASDEQRGPRGWPAAELRHRSGLLSGRRILLLGFGAIGRRLAELLAPFGVELRIVRSRAVGGEPGIVVTAPGDVDEAFGWADHVVSSLPDAPTTRGFVSRERLRRMRASASLHNVGRGATVDTDALLEQLVARKISAAFLDVTEPEPLPPDHPLWRAPGCTITPHMAGGRREEHTALVAHFLAQLERARRGEALIDRVL